MSKETLERIKPKHHRPRFVRLIRIKHLLKRLQKMEKVALERVKATGVLHPGTKVIIDDGGIQGEVKNYTQIGIPAALDTALVMKLMDEEYSDCVKIVLDKAALKRKRIEDADLDTIISGYEEAKEYWKVEPKVKL